MLTLTQTDFDMLDQSTEADLMGQLGLAVTGHGPDASEGLMGLKSAQTAMAWPHFIQVGVNYFSHIWPQVSGVVCAAYHQYTETNKDWIENAAKALLGLINIGYAVAVLIVSIAMKKGLDALCPAT